MKILIVEDDADISSLLKRGFESEGYSVDCASSGEAALERARSSIYGTIILDIMLPGTTGIDVCQNLRRVGQDATIIMLSARDSVDDRIEGLSAGADDYVVKPFVFAELLARVRAQERRAGNREQVGSDEYLIAGQMTFNPNLREIEIADRKVTLTQREADVLMLLMRNAGLPLSRSTIFEALWADQGGAAVNVVDVYVGYLRRKLKTLEPDAAKFIKTVRGIGFMFEPGRNLT